MPSSIERGAQKDPLHAEIRAGRQEKEGKRESLQRHDEAAEDADSRPTPRADPVVRRAHRPATAPAPSGQRDRRRHRLGKSTAGALPALRAPAKHEKLAAARRIRRSRARAQSLFECLPGADRTHGIFRPAAHHRRHARLDLRPDRHRLHDGLRHHRHDQLRPWRRVHGRRLHRADRVPGAAGDRHHLDPAGAVPGAADRHGADRALRLDRRAHRLPAAAPQLPPGAADFGDRHVDHPAELRADRAGRARQAAAADHHRRPPADVERGLRRRASPTSRSSSCSPRWC